MPGAISPATGLVKNANSTWLNGRHVSSTISSGASAAQVRLANDANCLAVSEATDGAAAGARVVFGVILGTGVGGGIAIDGRALITGANAIAASGATIRCRGREDDERPGPACYCGRRGCIETFLSGPGLAARLSARAPAGRVPAKSVVARRRAGDAHARAVLDAWIDRLARALASVINVLDPDVIVVGGGLSRIDALV